MSAGALARRILLWTAALFGSLVLLVTTVLLLAITTTPGAQFVIDRVTGMLPSLDVGRVAGPLRGPLVLEDVRYETASMVVRLDSVYVDLRFRDLLDRHVRIRRLFISGADAIVRGAQESPPSGAPDRSPGAALPVDITIERGTVTGLTVITQSGVSVSNAQVDLSGTPGSYDLQVAGTVSGPRIGSGQLRLSGTGDLSGLAIEDALLLSMGGRIRADGSVRWSPRPTWSLDLDADSIAPAAAFPEPSRWPGAVTFRGHSSGEISTDGPDVEVTVDTIFGRLRGHDLAGHGAFQLDTARLAVPQLRFSWGSARLSASGEVSRQVDLTFAARVPDVGLAVPDARGALTVEGAIGGTRSAPDVGARIDARGLEYGDKRLGSLSGNVQVNMARRRLGSAHLTAQSLSVGRHSIARLEIDAEGTRAEHRLQTAVSSEYGALEVELAGGLAQHTWSGRVGRLRIRTDEAGDWRLRGPPVLVTASDSAVELAEPICLISGESRICAAGAWRAAGAWQATAEIREVPLALLEPLIPAGWAVTGDLDGDIRIAAAASGAEPAVNATLEPGPGTLTFAAGGRETTLRYQEASIEAEATSDGSRANVQLALADSAGGRIGTLRAAARLPEYTGPGDSLAAQPVTGELALQLENLELIDEVLTRVDELRGSFALDVAVDGTVDAPRIAGEAHLRDAEALIPEMGVTLSEITITATGDRDGRLALEGSVRSGEGRIDLEGESPLEPRTDDPSRLSIEGDRFLAMDTRRGRLLASPDIDVEFDGDVVQVAGEVDIPEADIHLSELQSQRVPVSGDVVFVDSAGGRRPGQFEVSASVRLTLGDEVTVEGRGFESSLGGSLLITETPGEPTRGSGEIVIEDGSYGAFGQSLEIDDGELIFVGGPIDNPGLDITATRVTEDSVTVGLLIGGTLRAPIVTPFSQPPLPHDEILARLATGGGLGDGGAGDGGVESTLGLKGANLIFNRVVSGLQLDKAQIQSEGGIEGTSVLAGKYLSPRVYVAYGAGLLDPLQSFQIRYILSSKWTLVAETGDETSADVLYQIETGD